MEHKLLPGLGLSECTRKVAGSRPRVLLLHTSHLHAHMLGFDNYDYSQGGECLLDTLLDLCRQALLYLQATGKDIDHSRELG